MSCFLNRQDTPPSLSRSSTTFGYISPKLPRLSVRLVKLAMLLGLVGLLVYQALVGGLYQLRAAEWKFPKDAAEFLRRNQITDPIFNSYEYGGYLIWALWPEQRTFIDGRALNEAVYRDYVKILHIKRRMSVSP